MHDLFEKGPGANVGNRNAEAKTSVIRTQRPECKEQKTSRLKIPRSIPGHKKETEHATVMDDMSDTPRTDQRPMDSTDRGGFAAGFCQKLQIVVQKAHGWQNSYGPREEKQLAMNYLGVDLKTDILDDSLDRLVQIKSQRKPHVVIVGQTSSGKSTLLNSLVDCNLQGTSECACTSCFVTIDMCDEIGSSHYIYQGREFELDLANERSVERFQNLTDITEENCSKTDVHVFLSPNSRYGRDFLSGLSVTDCPGLEKMRNNDEKSMISGADVVILVIDVMSTLNEAEVDWLLQDTQFLSPPRLFVVLNKCDKLVALRPQKAKRLIREFEESIRRLSTRYSITVTDTYFVSAKEGLDDEPLTALLHGATAANDVSRPERQRQLKHLYFELDRIGRRAEEEKQHRFSVAIGKAIHHLHNQFAVKDKIRELQQRRGILLSAVGKMEVAKNRFDSKFCEKALKDRVVKFTRRSKNMKNLSDAIVSEFIELCKTKFHKNLLVIVDEVEKTSASNKKVRKFVHDMLLQLSLADSESLAEHASPEVRAFAEQCSATRNLAATEIARHRRTVEPQKTTEETDNSPIIWGAVGGAAVGEVGASVIVGAKEGLMAGVYAGPIGAVVGAGIGAFVAFIVVKVAAKYAEGNYERSKKASEKELKERLPRLLERIGTDFRTVVVNMLTKIFNSLTRAVSELSNAIQELESIERMVEEVSLEPMLQD